MQFAVKKQLIIGRPPRSREEGYLCPRAHGPISLEKISLNHNLIMADQSIAQLADIALR